MHKLVTYAVALHHWTGAKVVREAALCAWMATCASARSACKLAQPGGIRGITPHYIQTAAKQRVAHILHVPRLWHGSYFPCQSRCPAMWDASATKHVQGIPSPELEHWLVSTMQQYDWCTSSVHLDYLPRFLPPGHSALL